MLEGMAVCGLVTSDDVVVAGCVVVVAAALTTMWATSPRTWSTTAMAGYLLQNEERWPAAAMDSRPFRLLFTRAETQTAWIVRRWSGSLFPERCRGSESSEH